MHLLETTGERVLVIGGAGTLGSLVADAFEGAGWEVLRGARRSIRSDGWRLIDLESPSTIDRCTER